MVLGLILMALCLHAPVSLGKTGRDIGSDVWCTLDISKEGSPRIMPAVQFNHSTHEQALSRSGGPVPVCATCHAPASEMNRLTFVFRSAEAPENRRTTERLKDFYHEECISCHRGELSRGRPGGPLESGCRACHAGAKGQEGHFPSGMDSILHYRHGNSLLIPAIPDGSASRIPNLPGTQSLQRGTVLSPSGTYGLARENCGACHHVFDPSSRKVVWTKLREDTCRACHLPTSVLENVLRLSPQARDADGSLDGRPSLGQAAHVSCVNCHYFLRAANLQEIDPDREGPSETPKIGPVTCKGCHNPEYAEAITPRILSPGRDEYFRPARKVPSSLPAGQTRPEENLYPRIMRGQPDEILLVGPLLPTSKSDPDHPGLALERPSKGFTPPVSFDHKFHETQVNTCRACHHTRLAECASCHLVGGQRHATREALYAAGIFSDRPPPPLEQAMHKPDSTRSCIGCHSRVVRKLECWSCHSSLKQVPLQASCVVCHTVAAPSKSGKAGPEGILRTQNPGSIPDQVIIGLLMEEYRPVTMPHGKIIETLRKGQQDSRLAWAFHGQGPELCLVCHHNAPPVDNPSRCVSCHALSGGTAPTGQTGIPGASLRDRPALKAAYHLRCLGCHQVRQQKPLTTDCEGCHATAVPLPGPTNGAR